MKLPIDMLHAPIQAWISFLYLPIAGKFLAYVVWYVGMALGGIARVSQLQYMQPFLMILFAALFLGESITWVTILTADIVVTSVFIGKNATISNNKSISSKVKQS